jgi:hypothetical protein
MSGGSRTRSGHKVDRAQVPGSYAWLTRRDRSAIAELAAIAAAATDIKVTKLPPGRAGKGRGKAFVQQH